MSLTFLWSRRRAYASPTGMSRTTRPEAQMMPVGYVPNSWLSRPSSSGMRGASGSITFWLKSKQGREISAAETLVAPRANTTARGNDRGTCNELIVDSACDEGEQRGDAG